MVAVNACVSGVAHTVHGLEGSDAEPTGNTKHNRDVAAGLLRCKKYN